MIIDCFTYFNEKELLDFHINHVYDHVDKIIIIEGDRTYAGVPYTSELPDRPADGKIDHYIVPLLENPKDRWENEALQRRLTGEILKEYDGTVFFECVDEIVQTLWYDLAKNFKVPHTLSLDNFYYYFNGKDVGEKPDHPMPIVLPIKQITDLHEQWCNRASFTTIDHAGWHFSYLGGIDRIKEKLGAYSHAENDTPEVKKNLQQNIENGNDIFGRPDHRFEYVPLDETFPKELLDNQDKYKEFIHG